MDLTASIEPRSDQQNADDFMAGPRTFTIESVTVGSAEQPIHVNLVESPGKPYKPSKSMRRVLVMAWGPEGSAYTGRQLTLYRDPHIKFGGIEVGGICISHLSHLEAPLSLALTVTRGKRSPFTVAPLVESATRPSAPRSDQAGDSSRAEAIRAGIRRLGLSVPAAIGMIERVTGRKGARTTNLTPGEATAVLAEIASLDEPAQGTLDGGVE